MRAQQDNRAFSNSPRAPLNMIQSVYTPTTTKSPKITYPHHTRQFSQNSPRLPTGLEIERINTEPVYTSASDVRASTVNKIPGKIKQFENFFQKNLNHLTEHGLKNINYDTLDHLACYAQSSKSRVYTEDQDMMLQFSSKTRTEPNPRTPKISLQPLLSNSPRHILALSTLRSPDTSEERRFIDQPQTVRTPNEKKSNSKLKMIEKNIGSVSYRGTSSLTSQDFVQDLYKSKKGETQKKTNYSAKVAKKTSELEALIGGSGGHRKRGYSNNDKKTAPQSIFSPAEKQKMANMQKFPSIEKDDAQPIQSFPERKDSIIENNSESNNATQVMSGEGFPAKQGKLKNIHHSISGIEEIRKEQDRSVSSIYTEKPEKKKKVILKKNNSVSSGLRKSSSGSPKDPQSDNSLKTIDIDQDKIRMMKKLWIDTDNPELIGTQSSLDDKGSTRLQTKDISTISTTKNTQMTMSDLFMPTTAAVISEPLNLVLSSERVQSLPDELPKSAGFKIKKLPLKNNSTFKHMKSSVADESDADLSSKSKEQMLRKISAGTPLAQEETATLQIEKSVSEPTKPAQEPQFPKFDFQKKTMEVHFKHKKNAVRRLSVTIDPTIFETRVKQDFGAEFNSTVNTVVQKLYGSVKNAGSVSKIQGKTLSRGVTSDMEGLLRKESEEGVGRLPTRISKNNISESEFASTIIRLPTRLSEGPSEIIADPPTGIKEDIVTPTNRVYPVKNYIITVNINPPIEEASPRMEESLIPPGSFSTHLDAFEFGHMKSDEIAMGHSAGGIPTISNLSRQYKFELNAKKHVEDLIEEEKSIFGDADMSIMMNEQPFRNNAESLFKYEEIQSYMTYWASIKTLTSVTKANFFAFVEKIMLDPIHQKSSLCVFEEAYLTDIQKSNSAGSQNLFRYRPKTKDIMFNFIEEIYASLKNIIDNCSSSDEEEKFEAFEIKGKGSILPTSIMIVKEMTPSMLTPQLMRLDVAALKRIRDSYTFLDLFKFLCEGEALQYLKQDYDKLMRMERDMNLVNWKYAMKFFNRLHGSVLFGNFETNIELLKEDVQVKIEPKEIEQEEPLPEKKRRVPRSSTSRAGDFQSNGARILKAATKSIINSMRNSPKSTNTSGERKFVDFPTQASDEKQEPPSLNLQYTQFKRRYSKTTIKPFITLGEKQSLSVERTNTMFVRKQSTMTTNVDKQNSLLPNQASVRKQVSAFTNIEKQISLIPNQGNLSKGVTLAISDENGMDTSSNQLQIPTETHLANLAKIQSLPVNNKDDNKSKFSNERSRSRKNIFTTGNTINTSTRKSLSTNSDSQIQNSAQDVAAVRRPRALTKEPSYSTLFPPKVKGPSIVSANPTVKLVSMKTKEGDSLISRTPSPQQTMKNVITKMAIVNSLAGNATHKKRHTVRGVLEESGPRKALFYSIGNRNHQEVQGMLDMNPQEMINNARDEDYNTLLIAAVKSGKKAIVSLLISREVEIDAQNDEGNTALHVAIMHGLDDIADLLMQSGAKQTIRNNKGKICWEMVNYR